MPNPRLIMYHKHSTSARLRFLKLAYGGVCGFKPLPRLSQLLDEKPDGTVAVHPAAFISDAEQRLGILPGILARFISIDPPFDVAKSHDAEFIDLPQARNIHQVELELLRKAYDAVMSG
jgi:hypothetical protein